MKVVCTNFPDNERNCQVKKSVRLKHQVGVYTVSAQDYGRCIGLDSAVPDTFLSAEATEVPKLAASICDTVLAQRARSRVRLLESMEKQFKEDQFRPYQDILNRTRDWPFMELHSGCQSALVKQTRDVKYFRWFSQRNCSRSSPTTLRKSLHSCCFS